MTEFDPSSPETDPALLAAGAAIVGTNGDDTLSGTAGDDTITGGRGNDTLFGGRGNDTFVWNPGDGSDVVEGQAGLDTLLFNGSNASETIAIAANGARTLLTRDVGNIAMDLNGVETIHVGTSGGADRVTVGDLRGTAVNRVEIDLGAGGDGLADIVTVQGSGGDDTLAVTLGSSVVVNGLGAQTVVQNGEAVDTVRLDGGSGNDVVQVQGSAGDDTIGIARGIAGNLVVFTPAGGPAVEVTGAEQVVVRGGAGNDTISGSNGIGTLTQLTIDGGAGDDVLQGGDGDDILIGGAGNDFVDGNRGSDTASLGAGDDIFQWDPGDGSDVVEGDGGRDTLQFNGSNIGEAIAIAGSGTHAVLTRNVAAVSMDLHGMEAINVRALGGSDSIVVGDLRGTDVREVHVDLAATGGGDDGAADTVTVAFTAGDDAIDVTVPSSATVAIDGLGARTFVDHLGVDDHAVIDGGAGNDTAVAAGTGGDDVIGIARDGVNLVGLFGVGTAAVDITGVEHLVVRAGAGNDTINGSNGIGTLTELTLDGGAGDDTLRGGDGDDILLGGSGNDVVTGGRGSDTATLGTGDDTFVWNPGDGSDAVEGSGGNDTLQFNGSNIGETIAITADGAHAVLTRNVAAVTMDLHGMETLNVATLGGADQVTVGDLSGTGVKQVHVDLAQTLGGGDGQADTVVVTGTAQADRITLSLQNGAVVVDGLSVQTVVDHFDAGDTLVIAGGGGNDIIDTRGLGTGGPHVVIDLSPFAARAADFGAVLAHAHEDAGNTLLDLGDGHVLTLAGTDMASLHAEDFLFDAHDAPVSASTEGWVG